MSNLLDLGNNLKNLFGQGINNVENFAGNVIHNFQQPVASQIPQGRPLIQTPLANSQPINFGQVAGQQANYFLHGQNAFGQQQPFSLNNPFAPAPRVNLVDHVGANAPVPNFLIKAAASIPQSILNAPSDIQQAGKQTIKDFRSGDIKKPMTAISDVASLASPALTLGTLGGGTIAKSLGKEAIDQVANQTLKQAVVHGLASGAGYGGFFGALQGLSQSRNADVKQAILNTIINTGMGALTGGALGGAIGAGGNVIGQLVNKIAETRMAQGINPQQAQKDAQAYLRDRAGRFLGVGNKDTFETAGLSGKVSQPGQAMGGNWMDQVDKQLGVDKNYQVPVGLSTKTLTKEEHVAGGGASTKMMITKADEGNLAKLGYTPEDIYTMKPQEAGNILDNKIQKPLSQGATETHTPTDRTVAQPQIDPMTGTPYQEPMQVGTPQTKKGLSLKGDQTTPLQDSSVPASLAQDTRQALTGQGVKEKQIFTRLKGSDRYPTEVSQALTGSYVPTTNDATIAVAKKAVRLDPQAAETRALNPQNAVDQAIGAELFNYHMDNGNIAKANEILNATSGTNEGQMVQILSQYDKTSPSGAIKFAKGAVENYNKTHGKQLQLSDATIQDIYSKAKGIQSMPEGRDRNIASNDLMNQVNDLIPSSIVDKALTVWKAGLLTSLRTHERNLLGNAIMAGSETAKDIFASPVDRLMSLKTGKRSLAFNLQGTAGGVKKGLVAAKDIALKGYDPEETIAKFDQPRITWGKNWLEQALKVGTDTVFRSLGAEDKPFWHGAAARSLYDQAKVEAINAGKAGDQKFIQEIISKPTEQMMKTAAKDADHATFHDKNMLSDLANTIKNTASNPKYGKWAELGKAVTNILAPFTGVPSSVVGKTVDYSPIGLGKGLVNVGRVLTGHMPELQRQAAQEVGRGVIGTGLFGLGAYLMSKGLMTGQPKDATEANLWATEGKQANSILLPGTDGVQKWRSINSVGPQTLVLLAGAKYNEEMGKKDGSLGNYAFSLGKDQLNQTFLSGVQQPLNALTDPARYGQSYAGNQVASLVPNGVKDVAKSLDPYQRENNTISDYVTNSLPLLRNKNVPKRDVLGNIMAQEPTGPAAFTDLLNSKTPISNPVVDELGRLNDTGNSATPSKLNKNQTINGNKKVLTPEDLNTLESQSGPQVTQALGDLFQQADYKALSDEEKANAVNNTVAQVRKQVRGTVDLNNPTATATGNSGNTSTTSGGVSQFTIINPDTGAVKQIDLSKKIAIPTATGNTELDKRLVSSYNAALTTRGNDIVALYKAGKIDATRAGAELDKLVSSKIGGGTKAAKISIKSPTIQSIKSAALKLSKAPKLKLPKTPTFKISKPKTVSTTAKFKIKAPRIGLSTGKSARYIRKAAGISIPTSRKKRPVLTV